ncbi:3095_t:CDS:2, partial [Funneliformis geosporum]
EQNLSVDKWDIIIVQVESFSHIEFSAYPIIAILDEINAINRQMTYRNENIRVIDNKFQPLLGKSVEYLYDPNSGAKAMQIGYELLQQGKRVAFILTSCSIVQVLAEKASKLQRPDNSSIRACELDCVAYTSTVEAGISFEKIDHFDAVIGITNIVTPVNVEAFIQIMFQIRDCYKNIRAELKNARSNDLPTAIRGHRESSTDASFQLIKIDKSQEVIENHMDNEIWNNLCNKKFVKHFSLPELQKHFLYLSHFRKQGYDEKNAIKGLGAKDIAQ